MLVDRLTDAEVDTVLERYDQTKPHLQRRIVAEWCLREAQWQGELTRLRESNARLLAALKRIADDAESIMVTADTSANVGSAMVGVASTLRCIARAAIASVES